MEDKHIVIGAALVVVTLGIFAFLHVNILNAQSTVPNAQLTATAVPFVPIVRGSHSTVTTRTNYIITSSADLQKLWELIDATSTLPAVDFNTESVIAVFAGQQPTAGYSIAVSRVSDSGARLVSVTITKPDSSCTVASSITTPYQVVVVPNTTLPLLHEDLAAVTGCSN